MNFQGLNHIEAPEKYLDTAIKKTKKVVDEKRGQKLRGNPLQKSQTIEIEKLDSIERELRDSLHKILISYPSLDSLPEFYRELINNTMDVGSIKKSLGAVGWCIKKIQEFTRKYRDAIRRSTEIGRINQYRREFYGRIASTLKQIKPNFEYLEESRKMMMDFPTIKTGLPTIAIAGFPNVGKSTLLSKLTPAKPKIANYAFTTTGINLGYSEIKGQKIQFMDIPGTLARFERQNTVEKTATLALKYITDAVIYVFDLTETYPIKDQIELYETIKRTRKPVLIYLSKTDIADKKRIDEFKKKYKALTNADDLKKAIEKLDFI